MRRQAPRSRLGAARCRVRHTGEGAAGRRELGADLDGERPLPLPRPPPPLPRGRADPQTQWGPGPGGRWDQGQQRTRQEVTRGQREKAQSEGGAPRLGPSGNWEPETSQEVHERDPSSARHAPLHKQTQDFPVHSCRGRGHSSFPLAHKQHSIWPPPSPSAVSQGHTLGLPG